MTKQNDINNLIKFSGNLSELTRTIQSLQSNLYSDKGFIWPDDKAISIKLKKFLENRGVNMQSPEEIEQALNNLKQELSSLERVRVKIPVLGFSDQFWNEVFSWLKENAVKEPFILEKELDESIMGGIVIYWKGRYLDLSLKKKLDEFFEKELVDVSS